MDKSGGKDPLTLNFTPQPLYHREWSPGPTEYEDGAPERVCAFLRREKSLASAGIRGLNPPARSRVSTATNPVTKRSVYSD